MHAKGNVVGVFSRSAGRSDDAADRALQLVLASLEDSKAEDIVTINIAGKSALGDYMVVVSGRSNRHVMAIADHLITDIKDEGLGNARVEGLEAGADDGSGVPNPVTRGPVGKLRLALNRVVTESIPLPVGNGHGTNGHGNGSNGHGEPAAVTSGEEGKTLLGQDSPEDPSGH